MAEIIGVFAQNLKLEFPHNNLTIDMITFTTVLQTVTADNAIPGTLKTIIQIVNIKYSALHNFLHVPKKSSYITIMFVCCVSPTQCPHMLGHRF